MSKGEQTRNAILDAALEQATQVGLEGLTIGKLAEQMGMSKSGVFAHFRCREDLQLAVLDRASQRFVTRVLQPALAQPRGLPRLRAILRNWFVDHLNSSPRACLFLAASWEYDDRPGPLKDATAELHRRWRSDLARCVRQAVERGQLHPDTDPDQIAFQIFALAVGLHHDLRLFGDPKALERAEKAIDSLLSEYKVEVST